MYVYVYIYNNCNLSFCLIHIGFVFLNKIIFQKYQVISILNSNTVKNITLKISNFVFFFYNIRTRETCMPKSVHSQVVIYIVQVFP